MAAGRSSILKAIRLVRRVSYAPFQNITLQTLRDGRQVFETHCWQPSTHLRPRYQLELRVPEASEPPRTINPVGISAINTLPPSCVELSIFNMKCRNMLMIDVDKIQIVQLLQNEMRRIVIDFYALVILDCIKNGLPAVSQLTECFFDQPVRALWPWIKIWKGKGACEGYRNIEAKIAAGFCGQFHLLFSPFLPRRRVSVQLNGCKSAKLCVISRMNSDQLALKVG